ncbi:DNA polymerase III subunit beta [Candidatus Xiphinematobacter sp. Idaho Grape]|uniref:DNA polymerase III subunit beta n=1 Tax=Candidatus Xiphinematobacter sp. Idaho Grape TaxID=1704307 RepID=UPI000705AFCC|nr:DNA polymerase III subunit beta [Candidatus Xiphinematobacter sp. Idaho Grape]ALJ56522.1 DNA polymerase III subunit beta [Candidatus Xiphinematobacter sp. Idaho Grape]
MKLVLTKEALLEGLQRTQNVVGPRPTLPVLSNALLETAKERLRITTTDQSTTIQCHVPASVEVPGATTLPARRLAAIVRELCGGDVSIETDSRNVSTIRCMSSFFRIFGLPKEEFPELFEIKDATHVSIEQSTLFEGLKCTSYAISTDETRYILNGILFSIRDERLTLVATDGRRLALYEIEVQLPHNQQELEFILPTKTVSELQRLLREDGNLTLSITQNVVAFHLGTIFLISKLIEGDYPDYRRVIPGKPGERIKLEREVLLNTVRRVSLLSLNKTNSVRLTFTKNKMDITAVTPEIGEAKESLPVVYHGKDFSIAFNPEFLLDPLRNILDKQIDLDFFDEIGPSVLRVPTKENFLYVLMPMRIPSS